MTTQEKLEAWARWSNFGTDNVGYKSVWQAIFDSAPVIDGDYIADEKSYSVTISDSYAGLIDRAVCTLCKEAPVLGEIIKRKYLRKNTCKEIAIYYLTPLEYPGDKSGRQVSAKMAGVLLRHAHDAIEAQIDFFERVKKFDLS